MHNKQVDKTHYEFRKYMGKKRWISVWHQLDEVLSLNPSSILEIGPGPGVFKSMIELFLEEIPAQGDPNITNGGGKIQTVDIDPELKPDYVASATDLPLENNSFDCVCAFQMLEHLPYDEALKAFMEMVRVSKRHVVISLPDAMKLYPYSMYIPKLGVRHFFIPRPRLKPKEHQFNGEHHWEINRRGYPLKKIIQDFCSNDIGVLRTYRIREHLYHRFFVFEKC